MINMRLLEHAKHGDQGAKEQIINDCQKLLYKVLADKHIKFEDRDDFMQELYIKVLECIEKFDFDTAITIKYLDKRVRPKYFYCDTSIPYHIIKKVRPTYSQLMLFDCNKANKRHGIMKFCNNGKILYNGKLVGRFTIVNFITYLYNALYRRIQTILKDRFKIYEYMDRVEDFSTLNLAHLQDLDSNILFDDIMEKLDTRERKAVKMILNGKNSKDIWKKVQVIKGEMQDKIFEMLRS